MQVNLMAFLAQHLGRQCLYSIICDGAPLMNIPLIGRLLA